MYLAPNVYMTSVRGRAIVLDLERDRYFALGPEAAKAAQALIEPNIKSADGGAIPPATISALVAKGVLTDLPPPTGPTKRNRSEASAPTATLWPSSHLADAGRSVNFGVFCGIFCALIAVCIALKVLPFRKTIGWIANTTPRSQIRRGKTEQDLLDEYFLVRPWFPVKPICRVDALALCLYLRRNGQSADLVFGVRLEPFIAHCWVQRGICVINEPHEVVSEYSPIMLV